MHRIAPTLLLIAGLTTAEPFVLPQGTTYSASFACDTDKGPDKLFDGNPDTAMNPGGGTARSPDAVTSVTITFPAPVADLGGIVTGSSDKFANYWPKVLEFWADSDGDGRCDTKLGSTDKLGPGDACKGTHPFSARLPAVHALEIRCVLQNIGGGGRAWMMNEIGLLTDRSLPLATATPNAWKATWYADDLPAGTTVSTTILCEDGKGAEALIDRDPTTMMNPRGGTAKEGQPASVFLRFPAAVRGLGGLTLGRSDPYGNYTWQTMEFWADTTGKGTYDTLVGTATGGSEGRKRFNAIVPTVHGLELRVTKQSIKGTLRAFMLSEVGGLLFQDTMSDREMHYVIEDFEDLGSWRTWGANGDQPEGERLYGQHMWLCGAFRPGVGNGQGVGVFRYWFKDKGKLWAKRGKVADQVAFVDRITFRANPQGYASSIGFEMTDSTGKKFYTPGVAVQGSAWAEYAIDLRAQAWPTAKTLSPPFKLQMIHFDGTVAAKGEVLIDDLTVIGTVGRDQRVTINPVWETLTYDPARPLTPKYRVRNALDTELRVPLTARLYSSYDPKRSAPIAERSIPLTLPKWGELVVPVDFGPQAYGHYEVELSLAADGVAAKATDLVAVAVPNGQRVNRSPMWIGSQHPADWIADEENAFVFREVVAKLGLDCYRTGAPDKRVIDLGMLCAAGFGGMPKALLKPEYKGDERGEPADYAAYESWVKDEAAKKYAPYVGKVLAVEYYNEPDLPEFCFKPEIDVYLKMWRAWASGMRAGAPGIKLGTGGSTVSHGKEKKDFNPRMYTELAQEADIAVWHAHGPLGNYTSRQHMVEGWLEKGGKPKDKQLLGNSEAGTVSHNSPAERLVQADVLVKKIGWAKAQANSLYYTWFTTTDTYDPQGGYLGGENWGLIAPNQRLKPSGQAMNELIRNLANTTGKGEVKIDTRLQVCDFAREDGGRTWLFWPNEQGAVFLQKFAASGPVEVVDMFGRRERLEPKAGTIALRITGYPMYLHAAKGVNIGPAALPAWATVPGLVGVSPGAEATFCVGFANPWGKDANLQVAITDVAGKRVASATVAVAKDGRAEQGFAFALPKGLAAGSVGYVLRVASPEVGVDEAMPLMIGVGELVPKSAKRLVADGRPVAPAGAARIVVDQVTAVQDLVSDPQTPNWANAEDLSFTASLAHDGSGIRIAVAVKDQSHNSGEAGPKLWAKDSVQFAIAADGKQSEFGLTETSGGYGFCWMSPNGDMAGQPLKAPLAVKRDGGTTGYEVYLTFSQLGIDYVPGKLVRLTFMINEDDGRGRVRVMKWFDGIHPGKEVEKFGYLILE
jgi:hypothetical protein